jgi:hypothetical protein
MLIDIRTLVKYITYLTNQLFRDKMANLEEIVGNYRIFI